MIRTLSPENQDKHQYPYKFRMFYALQSITTENNESHIKINDGTFHVYQWNGQIAVMTIWSLLILTLLWSR